MNKKIAALVLFVTIILLNVSAIADTSWSLSREQADEYDIKNTPVNKLVRGVVNGATSWIEIPIGIAKVTEETQSPALGLMQGATEGLFAGIGRLGTGALDVVTFLVPPYDKPLMEPEYVLEQKPGKGLFTHLKSWDEKLQKYLW